MTRAHWVNLPQEDRFVEDGIPSVKHLGLALSLKVEWGLDEPTSYKMRAVPVGTVASYSEREKKDNANFTLVYDALRIKPDGVKWYILDTLQLPAAGGDQYVIETEHEGKVVKSDPVQVWRRLYYEAMVMGPPATPDPRRPACPVSAVGRGTLEHTLLGHFIELKQRGGATLPFSRNSDFHTQRSVAMPYVANKTKFQPYLMVIAFVHSIALRREKPEIFNFTISVPPAGFVGAASYDLTLPRYLWYGVDDYDDGVGAASVIGATRIGEQPRGIWLVSGSGKAMPLSARTVMLDIPDQNIQLSPNARAAGPYGGYNLIRVTLTPEIQAACAGTNVTIFMQLNTISGYCGGQALAGYCQVGRTSWFQSVSDESIRQVLHHEVGHLIGMLPEGGPRALDAPGTKYGSSKGADQYGHVGAHCNLGLTDGGTEWYGKPGCTMFGATSAKDMFNNSHTAAPVVYCGTCGTLVKKLDLSSPDGW